MSTYSIKTSRILAAQDLVGSDEKVKDIYNNRRNSDLLVLLQMQLEIERIDQISIHSIYSSSFNYDQYILQILVKFYSCFSIYRVNSPTVKPNFLK